MQGRRGLGALRTLWGSRTTRTAAIVWESLGTRNIGLISAGVAFFALLSLFPALTALVSVVGFLFDPAVVEAQLALLSEFVPEDAFDLIARQLASLIAANEGGIGIATLLPLALALWSARLGIGALMTGLNAAHDVPNRSGLRHILVAVVLTGTLIAVAITAIVAIVVLPVVLALLPLGRFTALALSAGTWTAAISVLVFGLAIVYRYGPNRHPRRPWFSPGLALAVGLWVPASMAFSWYLSSFGTYNEIYGSLGAVVALLMWFYIGAYSVLLGALLNAAKDRDAPDRDNVETPDEASIAAAKD